MSITTVKKWVYDALVISASPYPGTYPVAGYAGILHSYGFTTDNLMISRNRPSKFLETYVPHLILHIPSSPPTRLMGDSEIVKNHNVELEVWWRADFKGVGKLGTAGYIAPDFTNEDVSTEYLERLLKALEFTILRLGKKEVSANVYQPDSPKRFDSDGDESRIVGIVPTISAEYIETIAEPNDIDVLYRAMITWEVQERFQTRRKP